MKFAYRTNIYAKLMDFNKKLYHPLQVFGGVHICLPNFFKKLVKIFFCLKQKHCLVDGIQQAVNVENTNFELKLITKWH